jgi:hypothetical protein
MDAEYDTVDGSLDEVLSTTTTGKVRKDEDISPLRENGLT